MSEDRAVTAPSFGARLGQAIVKVFSFVLRLLFTVLIGAALGVGLYFGGLALYNQFVVPVQVNTIRLDILEARQEQVVAQLERRLNDLQSRTDALETRADRYREAIDDVRAGLEPVEALQSAQAEALAAVVQLQADLAALQADAEATAKLSGGVEDDLATLQEARDADQATLDRLSATAATVTAGQTAMQENLDSLRAAQSALDRTLDAMRSETDALIQTVDDLSDGLAALDDELRGDGVLVSLRQEVALLRVMGSLTRGRLLLVQSNYGLARSEIESARAVLVALRSEAASGSGAVSGQADAWGQAIARLEAALADLPSAPVAAADELEGAWQLLSASLPEATPLAEAAPAVEATPEATVESTVATEGTPEATAVPQGTPLATPTPAPTATP